jgi:hypothetical protein
MRKLLILAFVLIAKIASAQNKDTVGLHIPFTNGMVIYQKTFKAPGKSAVVLFNNSRSWFEKRYYSLDSVKIQDSANGRLVGSAGEQLLFKGPLGLKVSNRCVMSIEINSRNGAYTVQVSKIAVGYEEDPGKGRTYFTAEDLMDKVLEKDHPKGAGFSPVPFNKKNSKKTLQSLNVLIDGVIASINETMNN